MNQKERVQAIEALQKAALAARDAERLINEATCAILNDPMFTGQLALAAKKAQEAHEAIAAAATPFLAAANLLDGLRTQKAKTRAADRGKIAPGDQPENRPMKNETEQARLAREEAARKAAELKAKQNEEARRLREPRTVTSESGRQIPAPV